MPCRYCPGTVISRPALPAGVASAPGACSATGTPSRGTVPSWLVRMNSGAASIMASWLITLKPSMPWATFSAPARSSSAATLVPRPPTSVGR